MFQKTLESSKRSYKHFSLGTTFLLIKKIRHKKRFSDIEEIEANN